MKTLKYFLEGTVAFKVYGYPDKLPRSANTSQEQPTQDTTSGSIQTSMMELPPTPEQLEQEEAFTQPQNSFAGVPNKDKKDCLIF